METLGGDKQTQPLVYCPHCSPSFLDSPPPHHTGGTPGGGAVGEASALEREDGQLHLDEGYKHPRFAEEKTALERGRLSAKATQQEGTRAWAGPQVCVTRARHRTLNRGQRGLRVEHQQLGVERFPERWTPWLLPKRVAISCPILHCYCIPGTHLLPGFLVVAGYVFTSAKLQIQT